MQSDIENRQAEAAALAAQCDAMIVVGDRKSSNTEASGAVSAPRSCPQVCLVDERVRAGPAEASRRPETVGITAGASTPAWIIKEVNHTMSEDQYYR